MLSSQHPLVNLIGRQGETGETLRDVAMGWTWSGRRAHDFLVSIFRLGRGCSRAGQLIIVHDLDSVQHLQDVGRAIRAPGPAHGLIFGRGHQIRNPLNAMTSS